MTNALKALEAEGRLLNRVHYGPTKKPGRIGFRGELALVFAKQLSDEARPPELKADQVMAAAEDGQTGLSFFTCYLHNFASLKQLAEALGDALVPSGKYIIWANNIDLSKKYVVEYAGVTFYVLPIDEATVYNETLELLYIDRNDLKKLDTAAKLDAVVEKGVSFSATWPKISYEEGVATMLPERNAGEHRPV